MKAWTFQDPKQKAKLGAKACPWSVGWYDARGRKRQKRVGNKTQATTYARKLEGEAAAGLLRSVERVKWAEFVKLFERDHLETLAPRSRREYKFSLNQFARICKPGFVHQIDEADVDKFRAKRLAEGVEPTTVNKDLRHLRCALGRARKWKLIPERIEVELLREPERDPEFIDDEAFGRLYAACSAMSRPHDRHYSSQQWWEAILVFGYLTGWRLGEILALRRDDVDLEAGVAFVEAARTKGKRDARIELAPVVCEHLAPLMGFDEFVFRWPLADRALWDHFGRLKMAAKVDIPGAFHRLRFGFCNANVDTLPEDVLQQLMRHKARQTTRHYVNIAQRMKRQGTADRIHVPAVLAKKA